MRGNSGEYEDVFEEMDSIVDEYQDVTPYKKNGYELSVCLLDIRNETRWFYLAKIPICVLYDYPGLIISYLESFNVPRYCKATLEVVQVCDEECNRDQIEFIPIIKTRYIRLIQRVWKYFLKRKKVAIKKNSNPHNLFYRERCGHFQHRIPSLRDCVY